MPVNIAQITASQTQQEKAHQQLIQTAKMMRRERKSEAKADVSQALRNMAYLGKVGTNESVTDIADRIASVDKLVSDKSKPAYQSDVVADLSDLVKRHLGNEHSRAMQKHELTTDIQDVWKKLGALDKKYLTMPTVDQATGELVGEKGFDQGEVTTAMNMASGLTGKMLEAIENLSASDRVKYQGLINQATTKAAVLQALASLDDPNEVGVQLRSGAIKDYPGAIELGEQSIGLARAGRYKEALKSLGKIPGIYGKAAEKQGEAIAVDLQGQTSSYNEHLRLITKDVRAKIGITGLKEPPAYWSGHLGTAIPNYENSLMTNMENIIKYSGSGRLGTGHIPDELKDVMGKIKSSSSNSVEQHAARREMMEIMSENRDTIIRELDLKSGPSRHEPLERTIAKLLDMWERVQEYEDFSATDTGFQLDSDAFGQLMQSLEN